MSPSPYKITADGTSLEPSLNRWALRCWAHEWREIAEAEAKASERRAWQKSRLPSLITAPELAYVLGCHDAGGPPFADAADIYAGRRDPTPAQIDAILSHLTAKLDRAFPRTTSR